MAGRALNVRVEFSERGVCRVVLGRVDVGRLPASLRRPLARYLAGEPVRFRVGLDLSAGTAFQRKVWRVLLRIPWGQTRSYGWVARRIGAPRAVRAVGAACGANPVPILVPCHRVVRSDGSLGGFSAGAGWKERLLAMEGVCIPSRRRA